MTASNNCRVALKVDYISGTAVPMTGANQIDKIVPTKSSVCGFWQRRQHLTGVLPREGTFGPSRDEVNNLSHFDNKDV